MEGIRRRRRNFLAKYTCQMPCACTPKAPIPSHYKSNDNLKNNDNNIHHNHNHSNNDNDNNNKSYDGNQKIFQSQQQQTKIIGIIISIKN